MVNKIIPSLIAKNQEEFDKRYKKVSKLSKTFHLDVMDGKFVKGESLNFDLELPKNNYEAHLMIKDPEDWIKDNYQFAKLIIFHFSSVKDPRKIIRLIKSKKRKVGISVNPNIPISKIKPYLKDLDRVLVMTVHPGKYGARLLPKDLKKISEIKKINPKLKVEVDGGINSKTIKKASEAGANSFVVGSYLQKAKEPKKALKNLEKLIKK